MKLQTFVAPDNWTIAGDAEVHKDHLARYYVDGVRVAIVRPMGVFTALVSAGGTTRYVMTSDWDEVEHLAGAGSTQPLTPLPVSPNSLRREVRLGSTNVPISPLGLGLAALGRPGYINLGHAGDLGGQYDVAAMQAHAYVVLDAAWRAGIRYFDAARSYGRAEEFLGSWLRARQIPPDQVTIGSKWGYAYTANWQIHAATHEVKEHSLALLRRQWHESQANLGGYLRLYQIHSATLESGVLDNQPVLAELSRLKQTGLAIGLSLSGCAQAATLEHALGITVDGARLFDSVQVTWNLLETTTTPALDHAHALGMVIIVKEALANGRLTRRNSDATFASKLALLEREAARLNTTVDALALAAVLAQPWVSVVLSGATTEAQLASNLQAPQVAWDEQARANLAGLAEPPELYWETRKQLAWN